MDNDIICDVCGKDISDPVRTGGSHCMQIGLGMREDYKANPWVQSQFGIYKPGAYRICVECLLKGHGIKPNKKESNEDQEQQDGQSGQEGGEEAR